MGSINLPILYNGFIQQLHLVYEETNIRNYQRDENPPLFYQSD